MTKVASQSALTECDFSRTYMHGLIDISSAANTDPVSYDSLTDVLTFYNVDIVDSEVISITYAAALLSDPTQTTVAG
jgi:hypothetical protein